MQQPNVPNYTLVTTLGDSGAGKTTLARAMARLFAERGVASAPRLVRQGAYDAEVFELRWGPSRVYQHVDFASDAGRHALFGSAGFSAVIMAISAVDGILDGTRQSLELARAAGIGAVVVALTKCDLLEDVEILELVEVEVRDLFASVGLGGHQGPTIVRCVGMHTGDRRAAQAIDALFSALEPLFY